MGVTGNEVSAANQQRQNEEISKTPVGSVLESGTSVAGAVVALGTSLASGGHTGLVMVGSVVAGMGIVDWFHKLGTTKVNENLEALGQATEEALSRVEAALNEQGQSIDEIKRRLDSDELRNAMASASLQALRSTQQKRLKRLALILANGVKDDDLTSESTDDMMRAAVELTEHDILVLKSIYEMQVYFLTSAEMKKPYNFRVDAIRSRWKMWWEQEGTAYLVDGGATFRSSTVRLQSAGLIAAIGLVDVLTGPSVNDFELLFEGKKFYERLQEIGSNVEPK